MDERLQKILSRRGIASRRKAEEMIRAGRIKVDGIVVTDLGFTIESEKHLIEVDDKPIEKREPRTYILLNKPKGYLSTVHDPQGRKTVLDLLPAISQRIYPVGRLDYDTEGLLLLTNDGELTYLLTHPKFEIEKTYRAIVEGKVDDKTIEQWRDGLFIEEGKTAPAKVTKKKITSSQFELLITIHEGRKRQIKRMAEATGLTVIYLQRMAFAFLTLKGVPKGSFRYLTNEEVRELKKLAEENKPT